MRRRKKKFWNGRCEKKWWGRERSWRAWFLRTEKSMSSTKIVREKNKLSKQRKIQTSTWVKIWRVCDFEGDKSFKW